MLGVIHQQVTVIWDYVIWQVMYGNGVVIGMIADIIVPVRVRIRQVLVRHKLTAFFVAVAGATHQPAASQRIVTTTTRTTATAATVSGLSYSPSLFLDVRSLFQS